LAAILEHETDHENSFSPPPRLPPASSSNALPFSAPFLANATADAAPDALPYHWLELGEMLLEAAADDFEDPDNVRKLLRGLREVRMSKLRKRVEDLDAGGGVDMKGVGGMEVGEARTFVTGVIDNLRSVEYRSAVERVLMQDTGELLHLASSNDGTETERKLPTTMMMR
jgi:GINS complex subunit 2